MNNKPYLKTGIALIVVITVAIIGWWVIQNKNIRNTPILTVVPNEQVVVLESVDKEIKESAELYEVSIHYPYYSIPVIDDEINRYIDNVRSEFVKSFTPVDDVLREMFTNGNKGFLTITYNVKKSIKISTIVFHGSQYTGGAHPTPFISTFSIGIDGKLLGLSDLFSVSEPEYLTVLSEYASGILSNEYGDGFFKEGADTNPENWNNWYIDENGNLVILFGAYQVAAYVNGEPDVSIPFSEIKSIAKPEFFN